MKKKNSPQTSDLSLQEKPSVRSNSPEDQRLKTEGLRFKCSLTITAAGDEKAVPSFSMVAYTGGVMRIAGFTHPVVVDLEGLAIERQNLPIRLDHNSRQGVGHTNKVAIENSQIIAEGLISRDTSWAKDVAQSGRRGFPWQASIGADVQETEFIPNGQSVCVNGRRFDGPLYVVRQSLLKEISFVDSGADAHTSAQVAAQEKENDMEFTQWLKAKGFEMDSLSEEQKSNLQAMYDAEQEKAKLNAQADDGGTTPEGDNPPTADDTLKAQGDESRNLIAQLRTQTAAEVQRIAAVRQVCGGNYADIEAQAIAEGWSEDKTELKVLRASRPQVPAVHTNTAVTTPTVFEAVALMASGAGINTLQASYDQRTLEAADKLRGVGIQEFCERVVGQPLPRFRRDASGWLQAAFSSTSLPLILSNVANKMLLEGYNYIEDAWRRVCKIASVNDFKEHTRYRMTSNFKFLPVGADGELKHGQLDEQTFAQKAETHGIMFALTRQMIINDDMGAFTDIPRQIGMGAAEAIADAVWALLLSNPSSFFSSGHKNYASGADTALSVDGLTAAEILFLNQTKPNGRPLGIVPSLLLVPTALKVTAELLMASLKLNETTTANKAKPQDNPHAGKFGVVSSSYLGNTSFSGASSKAWYLFADPNRLPTLELAFLNGVDRPTVEKTDADFNTLGIQFRGYIDFGVREQDYRGAVKMKGEA